ncbi:MAG TPA: nicotinate-nucleotide adenylyltransferase [Gammaproteobacteria bacterium]|nr:nicotinate-nucleotide adenylyltransferase [Gammaproteobacteria bacterium]
MRKIGIFGGTFDPIHYGHLRPALEILDALSLDSMLFIPAGQPPHRRAPRAGAELRLAMVRAAVQGERRFQVDERELRRSGPSYMADTLAELKREYPDTALVLVLGTDAFLGLSGWERWREIFDHAHVTVAHRPGWWLQAEGELASLLAERYVADAAEALKRPAGGILLRPVTQLEISSTRIREEAAAGRELRYLVPDAVRDLIVNSACYRKES